MQHVDIDPTWEVRSLDMAKTNLYALLFMLPMAAVVIIPYVLIHDWQTFAIAFDNFFGGFLIFLLIFAISIIIHEALHAIGWKLGAGIPWSAFKFGVIMMTPYAHSKVPMHVRGYRIGAALPGIVLGILPAVYAWVTGDSWWLIYAVVMFTAASGDALILWIIRDLRPDQRVQDHPSEAGCLVLPDDA